MFRLSRYPLLVSLAILVCCVSASAQRDRDTYSSASATNLEIVGQVRLAGSGAAATRIPVRLERFGGGIVDQIDSDSTGRFRFANLARGYYRVIVNAPGYQPSQQDADLQVVFRAYLVFELTEQKASALTLLDVIDARAPADAREELFRGRTAMSRKSYPEAITHLQKAISIYPDFYEAHLLLGTVFVDQREWQKAETPLQRAAALKTDSPMATFSLGEVYWRERRYEDAEQTLLAGLKLDEKSWNGYFNLARLYYDIGNIMKAANAIGHTLQLKPDFAEGHLVAGNILLKVNQPERALTEYQTYLKLDPKGEFAVPAQDLVDKLSKSAHP